MDMSVSKHISKSIMGKNMIVACILLSSLYINVAGNHIPINVNQLKDLKITLKAKIFQRQLLERRNTDNERNNGKIKHAINNVEKHTEFQQQYHIDNVVSTNNVQRRNLKKVYTIREQLAPTMLKVENVRTLAANQIDKREPIGYDDIKSFNMSYTSCHVKEVCDDQKHVSDPCSIIIPRADWHGRNAKDADYMKVPVKNVFIHHTAMDRCYTTKSCSSEMRKIQNFHMDEKGWNDIGYSFLVGDDGNAYEARGWDRIGAHTLGWNDKSISIAVMGDFNNELPSQPALKAIDRLVACGIHRDKVLPLYNLYGHRDAASQFDSPGHKLYDLIKSWSHFKTLTS